MELQVSVRGITDRLVQLADDEYRHAANATGVGLIVEAKVPKLWFGRSASAGASPRIQFGVPDVGGAGGVYAGQTPAPCGTPLRS